MSTFSTDRPILFFDGVCNLCNAFVQFIIKRDRKKQFLFASLQSEAGQEAMKHTMQQGKDVPGSVVLYYNGRYYTKGDVVLHTAKLLGGFWTLLLAGHILPRGARNVLYDFVARNRYKWFGKKEECMIPTPELKSRFLT